MAPESTNPTIKPGDYLTVQHPMGYRPPTLPQRLSGLQTSRSPTRTPSNISNLSNASEAGISRLANGSDAGPMTEMPPSSSRIPTSEVGPAEIKRWVETGTMGSEDGIGFRYLDKKIEAAKGRKEGDTKKEILTREVKKVHSNGKLIRKEEGVDGQTENKEEPKEYLDAKLGKCETCKKGKVIWADEGEFLLVCEECGEPN